MRWIGEDLLRRLQQAAHLSQGTGRRQNSRQGSDPNDEVRRRGMHFEPADQTPDVGCSDLLPLEQPPRPHAR